jgi:hypothetical protein
MGLLDDLKKQVEEKEHKERQQNAELKTQQRFYDDHLQKVMQRAHEYFAELVEHLKAVAPDISPVYPISPPKEPPVLLKQEGYGFRSDSYEKPTNILVYCECNLAKRHEFYVRTKAAVESYSALLDSYNFPYYTKNELDQRHNIVNARFVLEGPLKVQIRLLASPEDRCLYLDLLNIEDRAVKRYKLSPENLDEALLDRVARMLVREEETLFAVKLSDDARAELRRQVEEDKQRKALELAEAEAQRKAARLAEEEAKLINRARNTVAGSIRKILSKDE